MILFWMLNSFLKHILFLHPYEQDVYGSAVLWGEFTFRGVTKQLKIDVAPVGHGTDPWFGYRRGFVGKS